MKILTINNSPLTRSELTGIELVTSMVINILESSKKYEISYVNWGSSKSRVYKALWSLFFSSLKLKSGDVYISCDGILPIVRKKGIYYVVIIHDVIWRNKNNFERIYHFLGTLNLGVNNLPIFISEHARKSFFRNDEVKQVGKVIYNISLVGNNSIKVTTNKFLIIGPSSVRKNLYIQLLAWRDYCSRKGCFQELSIIGKVFKPDWDRFCSEYFECVQYIRLMGYVAHDVKVSLLQTTEIVLCASSDEGLGLPFVEAIEYGCIPVGFAIPSYLEICLGRRLSILSESNSVESLSDILFSLSEDKDLKCSVIEDLANIRQYWLNYDSASRYLFEIDSYISC